MIVIRSLSDSLITLLRQMQKYPGRNANLEENKKIRNLDLQKKGNDCAKRSDKMGNTRMQQSDSKTEALAKAVAALGMKEQEGCTGAWLMQSCYTALVLPSWFHLLCKSFFPHRMNPDCSEETVPGTGAGGRWCTWK